MRIKRERAQELLAKQNGPKLTKDVLLGVIDQLERDEVPDVGGPKDMSEFIAQALGMRMEVFKIV